MDRRRRRARRAPRVDRFSTSTSRAPIRATRRIAFARRFGGAAFPLSERHGAWRVVADGSRQRPSTSRRSPDGIDADLASRDFTFNAIAERRLDGRPRTTRTTGVPISDAGVIRVVSRAVFLDDPLRLLRAVRLRGRARLPDGRAHGGAPARVRRARHAARGRAHPRGAPATLGERLPSAATTSACSELLGGALDEPARRARRPGLPARGRLRPNPRGCRSRTS